MGAAAILNESLRPWAAEQSGPLVVGVCGAQGSGKSTVCGKLAERLSADGRRTDCVALDDFYLTRSERQRLARDVHPLFATRGPPGTHDVALACAVLDGLRAGEAVRLPVFDKLSDDRLPEPSDHPIEGPVDIVLFEGWCVGARPQPAAALAEPVNALERMEDGDARWRTAVNEALAGPYAALFARLDRLVLLQAPSFDVVQRWRTQQEEANAAAAPKRRALAMGPARIARFIQHYERLTRWMLVEIQTRADLVIALDEARRVAHPILPPPRGR